MSILSLVLCLAMQSLMSSWLRASLGVCEASWQRAEDKWLTEAKNEVEPNEESFSAGADPQEFQRAMERAAESPPEIEINVGELPPQLLREVGLRYNGNP